MEAVGGPRRTGEASPSARHDGPSHDGPSHDGPSHGDNSPSHQETPRDTHGHTDTPLPSRIDGEDLPQAVRSAVLHGDDPERARQWTNAETGIIDSAKGRSAESATSHEDQVGVAGNAPAMDTAHAGDAQAGPMVQAKDAEIQPRTVYRFDSRNEQALAGWAVTQRAVTRDHGGRLAAESDKFRQQRAADDALEDARLAYLADNLHGVPDPRPVDDLPSWARNLATRVEEAIGDDAPVLRTDWDAVLEGTGGIPDRARLVELIDGRRDKHGSGPSSEDLADQVIRELARTKFSGPSWTQKVKDRFQQQWEAQWKLRKDGSISKQEFDARFDRMKTALPDEYEIAVAADSVRLSAHRAFDALTERPAGRSIWSQERSRAEFGDAAADDVYKAYSSVRRPGLAADTDAEGPGAFRMRDGTVGRVTSEGWDRIHRLADASFKELEQGLRARLDLDGMADGIADSLGARTGSGALLGGPLHEAFLRDFKETTARIDETDPRSAEPRRMPYGRWQARKGELGPDIDHLTDRWRGRLDAMSREEAVQAEARRIAGNWRNLMRRGPKADVRRLDSVDPADVAKEYHDDLLAAAKGDLADKAPEKVYGTEWDAYIDRLQDLHNRMQGQLPARFELHLGVKDMLAEAEVRFHEAAQGRAIAPRLRTELNDALAKSYKEAVGRPEYGLWRQEALRARIDQFRDLELDPMVRSLPDRLDFEAAAEEALRDAGARFHSMTSEISPSTEHAARRFTLTDERLEEMGRDFGTDYAAGYHTHFGPQERVVKDWAAAKKDEGDPFGTELAERWDQLERKSPGAVRQRLKAAAESQAARERLGRIYRDMLHRQNAIEKFASEVRTTSKRLDMPDARTVYEREAGGLRQEFAQSWAQLRRDHAQGADGLYDSLVQQTRRKLEKLADEAEARDSAFQEWRDNPTWTLDHQSLQVVRDPMPAAALNPAEARTASTGAAQVILTAPIASRTADTRAATPVPTRRTGAAEIAAEQALSLLHESTAGRDAAYRAFEDLLAAHPAARTHDAGHLVRPLRDWYADTRTGVRSGDEPVPTPEQLTEQTTTKLEAITDGLAARSVTGELFRQHVAATARRSDARAQAFTDSERSVQVEDAFHQALVDELGARTLASHPGTELPAGVLEQFIRRYAEARQEWEADRAARQSFAAALVTAGPRERVDLSLGSIGWNQRTRTWYERGLADLEQGYAADHRQASAAQDPAAEIAALAVQARQAAGQLLARAGRTVEAVEEFRRHTAAVYPHGAWSGHVTSWFTREKKALEQSLLRTLVDRGPAALASARAEFDHDVADLYRTGDARDGMVRDFDALTADRPIESTTLTSHHTVDWVGKHLDAARQRYVEEREAAEAQALAAEGHIPAPAHATAGDRRVPAWTRVQRELRADHDRRLSDAATADEREEQVLVLRQDFDEEFARWARSARHGLDDQQLRQVREAAWTHHDKAAGPTAASEDHAVEPAAAFEAEAVRLTATARGRAAFDRAFHAWRNRLEASGQDMRREPPLSLRPEIAEAARAQVAARFAEQLREAVDQVFPANNDLGEGWHARLRQAAEVLRGLTGRLAESFELAAVHAARQELLGKEAGRLADGVFRDHLDKDHRTLLEEFGAKDTVVSPEGRQAVLAQAAQTLHEAFTTTADRIGQAASDRAGQAAPDHAGQADGLAELNRLADELSAGLPAKLAAQAAREQVGRGALRQVDEAVTAWESEPPALSTAFTRRFGISPALVRPRAQQTVGAAVATEAMSLFDKLVDGPGALDSRLEEFRSGHAGLLAPGRINALLLRQTARHAGSLTADEVFAARLTRWRESAGDAELSEAGVERAMSGWRERVLSAFDSAFAGKVRDIADLTGGLWSWDARLRGLAGRLPDHFAFESAVPGMLDGVARAADVLGVSHVVSEERLRRAGEAFRDDVLDAYARVWSPEVQSPAWAARAAASDVLRDAATAEDEEWTDVSTGRWSDIESGMWSDTDTWSDTASDTWPGTDSDTWSDTGTEADPVVVAREQDTAPKPPAPTRSATGDSTAAGSYLRDLHAIVSLRLRDEWNRPQESLEQVAERFDALDSAWKRAPIAAVADSLARVIAGQRPSVLPKGGAPGPAIPRSLLDVFGADVVNRPEITGMVRAVDVLEAARRGDPAFGDARVDLSGVVRRILHLDDGPISREDVLRTLSLVNGADRRHRAGSLPALGAYGLHLAGAVAGPNALRGMADGQPAGPTGRNWTARPDAVFLHGRVAVRGGGRRAETPAPWGTEAHVLVPERADDGAILVTARHGDPIGVDEEEFVELVVHDQSRRAGVPIVLVLAGVRAGHGRLARLLADRAGTRVWYPNGDDPGLAFLRLPDGTLGMMPRLDGSAPGRVPVDQWLPADPGQLAAVPGATVRAQDGTVFPDEDVRSYLLLGRDGRTLRGAALINEAHTAQLENALRGLPWMRHYAFRTEAIPGLNQERLGQERLGQEGESKPDLLDWPVEDGFVLALRGDRGRPVLPRDSDGLDYHVPNEHLVRFVDRFLTTLNVPAGMEITVVGHDWGHLIPEGDPLESVPIGQVAATVTGRPFRVSTVAVRPAEAEDDRPPRLVMTSDPTGPRPRWVRFVPEPDAAALGRLADYGRLPADLPRRRTRALRWIRAMRELFGPGIDTDEGQRALYFEALKGFAALERYRLGRPGPEQAGPLTWAELGRRAAGYARTRGLAPGLRPDLVLAMLRDVRVAATLRTRETVERLALADSPDAPGTHSAVEDLTRRVLHLDPHAPVTPADLLDLRELTAFAEPGDLTDGARLTRFFLDHQIMTSSLALSDATLLLDGEDVAGRDFTGSPGPAPELDAFGLRGGDGRLTVQDAPWTKGHLVHARDRGGAVEVVTSERTFVVEDPRELAMLIAYDPRLPQDAEIVLAVPPAFGAETAEAVHATTGHPVWWSPVPSTVPTRPGEGARRLVLEPGPGERFTGWGHAGPRSHGSGPQSVSDDRHSLASDDDADFDRRVEAAMLEREWDAHRPQPLRTREYTVEDNRGDGLIAAVPDDWAVEAVRAAGEDAAPLYVPRQSLIHIDVGEHPWLSVSADRTLAVLADGEEGEQLFNQQVWATRKVIETASAKLASMGAGVRLRAEQDTVLHIGRGEGPQAGPLLRVTPEFLSPSGTSEHENCRDFAEMLASGPGMTAPLSHLVFRTADGRSATAEVNALDGYEVTGTHFVADALAAVAGEADPGRPEPAWAAGLVARDSRLMGGENGAPRPGETYGRALRYDPPGNPTRVRMTAGTRAIGVNEHAWAEVGEGYVFQSISTTDADGQQTFTQNFAKPDDPGGPHFGYHFAQVVMASENGEAQVALENFSRSSDIHHRLRRIIDGNLRAATEESLRNLHTLLGERIEDARREGADPSSADRLSGYQRFAGALADIKAAEAGIARLTPGTRQHDEARSRLDTTWKHAEGRLKKVASVIPGEHLWHFKMYSKRPGETPHEVNGALLPGQQGATANPLTAVTLHGQRIYTAHQKIWFDDGADTPSGHSLDTINRIAVALARIGLWNAAHGLPLPQVTITGRGNGAGRDAERRTVHAHSALRAALTAVLDRFQAHMTGPAITVDRYTFAPPRTEAGGAAIPESGYEVSVHVDDRRGSRRPSTAATADQAAPVSGARQILRRWAGILPGRLLGGSPDAGVNPLEAQRPIGLPVTLDGPRYGGVTRAADVPAVPAADAAPRAWFSYVRPSAFRSEPFSYAISDTGHIGLPPDPAARELGTAAEPVVELLPPTGWTRFGDDFVHETGAYLRGDNGWLGRLGNSDAVLGGLRALDPEAAPYRLAADPSSIYLIPLRQGSAALAIPLSDDTVPSGPDSRSADAMSVDSPGSMLWAADPGHSPLSLDAVPRTGDAGDDPVAVAEALTPHDREWLKADIDSIMRRLGWRGDPIGADEAAGFYALLPSSDRRGGLRRAANTIADRILALHLPPHDVYHASYANTLLQADPVDVVEVLTALRRWSSTSTEADGLPRTFQLANGVSLATMLDDAVRAGRLAEEHVQDVLREIGFADVFPIDDREPGHTAVPPGDKPHLLPVVIAYTERLWAAVGDRDAETALGMLVRLDRDLRKLWAVSDAWQAAHGTDLRTEVELAFPEHTARFAYALGSVSAAPLTREQAQRWYDRLATLTFHHHIHGPVPVPVGHPEDGCQARAHLWTLALLQGGVATRKAIVARMEPQLFAFSPNTADGTNQYPGVVSWGYHIAPTAEVMTEDGTGQTETMVFDPAIAERPVTVAEWIRLAGVGPDEPVRSYEGPLDKLHAEFVKQYQEHEDEWVMGTAAFPRRATVVLTDNHSYGFPSPDGDVPMTLALADVEARWMEDMVHGWAVEVDRRTLSRALWGVLLASDENPADALREVIGRHRPPGADFLTVYHHLNKMLRTRLTEADREEITAALSAEDFRIDPFAIGWSGLDDSSDEQRIDFGFGLDSDFGFGEEGIDLLTDSGAFDRAVAEVFPDGLPQVFGGTQPHQRGGLRGGSPNTAAGSAPAVRRTVRPGKVTRPRYGGVAELPAHEVPSAGKAAERWFAFGRGTASPSATPAYEVSSAGRIRLADGTMLPSDGWLRIGDDLMHETAGVLLRGDTGAIRPLGRVAAPDAVTTGPDGSAVPYAVIADERAMYLFPDGAADATAIRVPLRDDTAARTAVADPRDGEDGEDGDDEQVAAPNLTAVHGEFEAVTGTARIGGAELDAAGTAAWIRRSTDWRPAEPVALLLTGPEATEARKTFADEVADHLDTPVAAPDGAPAVTTRWRVHPPARPADEIARLRPPAPPVADTVPEIVVTPADPEPEVTEEAVHEAPWYLERRALGEARVVDVLPWAGDEELDAAADAVAGAARREGDSAALAAGIRDGVRDLLGSASREGWQRLLQRGRTLVADGRLVWLRPVTAAVEPAEQPEEGDVRVYGVSFASTTSGGGREHQVSMELDGMLLSILSIASQVASTLLPGLPRLAASVAQTWSEDWKRSIVAGRKLFVNKHTRFDSGLRMMVFVDGEERGAAPVPGRRLALDIPEVLATAGAPAPDPAEPVVGPAVARIRRPGAARDILNAIDLIPVVAALQRRLLGAGLPATSVHTTMDKVLGLLNEQSVRNRSRVFGTSGVVTEKIIVPAGRNALGLPASFQGHFVLSADIDRVQYLGETKAKVREDSGSAHMVARARQSMSKAATGFAFDVMGLHHDESGGADAAGGGHGHSSQASGFAPLTGVTLSHQRPTGHQLTEQSVGHTVLNQAGRIARYLADQQVTVTIRSTTHTIDPVRETAVSEIAVPGQDAAEFERRLLGTVRTPALRTAGQPDDLPVAAQPYVRALLREAALPLPARAYRRPARLDEPLPAPHPREPLALATRRGQGLGMQIALPGAELVHDQLRAEILRADIRRHGHPSDWSKADLDMSTWFSRPALEGDLPEVMHGIGHTVRVGDRDYLAFVRLHLRERVTGDPRTLDMTVNARAQQAVQVKGHRGTEWQLKGGAGAGARVGILDWLRVQAGGFGVDAGYGQGGGQAHSGTVKSYRRTETTGDVDEHVYSAVYELAVRGPDGVTERWWIDRPAARREAWWTPLPADIVARLVVPRAHVPAEPIDARTLALAGSVEELLFWPDDEYTDFADRTSGVYPAFFVIPELPRLAARLYAEANELPETFTGDDLRWPEGLRETGSPGKLAAFFGAETGIGRTIPLPKSKDGWKQAIRLRLRGYRTRHLGDDDTVELEQYAQVGTDHRRGREHGWQAGPSGSFGPQFHLGHGLGGKGAAAGGHGEGAESQKAFLTAGAHVRAGVRATRKKQKTAQRSGIAISRATYGGNEHGFRMDPVFEVTLQRWKGSRLTETTRYLRVRDAMETLVPERMVHDLGLTELAGIAPRQAAGPPVRHIHPALLPGSGYPERLRADDVLPAIKADLRAHGVLRTETEPDTERANLLLRELENSFSGESLRNQYARLTAESGGVERWLPLPRPFGATTYLWVRVTAKVREIRSESPRPEVKLTLRVQTQDQHGTKRTKGRHYGVDVDAHVVGGKGDGEGGLQGGAGYEGATQRSTEAADRRMEIYRANPRDASHEFEHGMEFTVETGVSTELPEILEIPLRGATSLFRRGAGLLKRGRDAADWWDGHRPFVWSSERRIAGDVRILVPAHLVEEGPGFDPVPVLGAGAAWHRIPMAPDLAADRIGEPPRTAYETLAEGLHPFALPAAAAVHRWAALAAAPFRPPADLSADGAWRVPGLETSMAGVRYRHFASAAMLLPNILELLTHRYRVPVGGDRSVTFGPGGGKLPVGDRAVLVGANIVRAQRVGPRDGALFKARHYTQDDEEALEDAKKSGGFLFSVGVQAAGADEERNTFLALLPVQFGFEDAVEQSGRLDETEENNRQGTSRYGYYGFDLELQFAGPHGILRVTAPRGLYGMLPLEKDPDTTGRYRAAGALEELLPDVFGADVELAADAERAVDVERAADVECAVDVERAADVERAVAARPSLLAVPEPRPSVRPAPQIENSRTALPPLPAPTVHAPVAEPWRSDDTIGPPASDAEARSRAGTFGMSGTTEEVEAAGPGHREGNAPELVVRRDEAFSWDDLYLGLGGDAVEPDGLDGVEWRLPDENWEDAGFEAGDDGSVTTLGSIEALTGQGAPVERLLPSSAVPTDAGDIRPEPIWYTGGPVYRADSRDLSVIFDEGFRPRGSDLDLAEYVRLRTGEGTHHGFVGAEPSRQAATDRLGEGWVVEIDAAGGIDVPETLGAYGIPFTEVEKVAYAGGVASRHLVGAWAIMPGGTAGNTLGPWHPNPRYRPSGPARNRVAGTVRITVDDPELEAEYGLHPLVVSFGDGVAEPGQEGHDEPHVGVAGTDHTQGEQESELLAQTPADEPMGTSVPFSVRAGDSGVRWGDPGEQEADRRYEPSPSGFESVKRALLAGELYEYAVVEETDVDRPSASALRPDPWQSTEPVWRDFFGEDGRWSGRTYFAEGDYGLRAPALARLPLIRRYNQWSVDARGQRSAVRRRMPASDAWLVGHGDVVADEPSLREFAERVARAGGSVFTVVACSDEAGLGVTERVLQGVANTHGLTIHQPERGIAVVPGTGGLPDEVHLGEDEQGAPTRFRTFVPWGGAPVAAEGGDEEQTVPSDGQPHYPASEFWNIPAG
ncbi:protein-glutamine glutaminase family protein [Streptomyces sp. NPDC005573]|uniref:protein-glutamine glutaminase family protein n=1 Tax=Streptomyces sp. NPDC005573 TaxID=3156890 RepID=UPI0033A70147